jgi:hypothetical protein
MPLDTYSGGNFRKYLQDNAAGADTLCVLVHVPKTAGTSLGTLLMRARKPSHNIYVRFDGNMGQDSRKALAHVLDGFLGSEDVKKARFMTGHFDGRNADRIQAARPDSRFITMLRNPVDRVVSEYRYMLTEKHPAHLSFRASFPDIRRFIQHPRSQNLMFKRLAPPLPVTNLEAVEFIKKRFSFVGISEEYEMSLLMLGKLLGVQLDPRKQLNATSRIAENEFEITDDIRSQIEETNKRDIALYRYFSNLFQRAAKSMTSPSARQHADNIA